MQCNVIFISTIGVVGAGASAKKGAVVEDNKVKIHVEAHQTIGHLKELIDAATNGVEPGVELQADGAEQSSAYDDEDSLRDCGLVSGSVVRVPAELLEILFILPQGIYL